MNFLRNLTDLVAFCINLAAFRGIFQIKTQDLFSEIQSFFQEETTFLTFWETLLFQLHPITKFLSVAFFWTSPLFFRKTHTFYLLKSNFERFEWSYFFSCILPPVCYVQRFFEKIQYLFSKNPPNFSVKKPKVRTFRELQLIQSHSTAFLLKLLFFFKKTIFFEENIDFN